MQLGGYKMVHQRIQAMRPSNKYLRGQFPGKVVVSKRGDRGWPPGFPDLTVCDFFLWGYLKQKI